MKSEDNANSIQGRYLSDVFLIDFPPHTQIFRKNGNQGPKTNAEFATFVHEYWHYLLNISTTIGYRDFSIWHNLIPIFTKTLMENSDGTSVGLRSSEPNSELLKELNEMYLAYLGSYITDPLNGAKVFDFTVIGEPSIEDYGLQFKGKKIHLRKVLLPIEIQSSNGVIKNNYLLGNMAINESIANSIEKMVFDDSKIAPSIPYLVLNKLSAFYNGGKALSNYELAFIGTLGFLTTDPACSIILQLKDYVRLRKELSIKDAISHMCTQFKPKFITLAGAIKGDLASIKSIYADREPMNLTINYIADKMEKYIDNRIDNLLFDLEPFDTSGKVDKSKLENLIFKEVPPCDVRQQQEGDEDKINRDILNTFDLEEINLNGNIINSGYLMQVLQCQLDFFKSHWLLFNDEIMRSEIASSKCPYYTTCHLPTRVNNSDVCKKAPWKSFSKTADNCMYGTAVAALLGVVKIKKKV